MSLPNFIRIERGSDGGPMTSNLTRCLLCSEISEYQCFDVCCPQTSSCASKPLLLLCKLVIPQCMCQVSLGLKEVKLGPMTSNLTRCLLCSEINEYQCFDVCCPQTSSCASKPLLLLCKLVIPQCMCQVSLGLKEVKLGPMTSNLTRCLFCSKISEY